MVVNTREPLGTSPNSPTVGVLALATYEVYGEKLRAKRLEWQQAEAARKGEWSQESVSYRAGVDRKTYGDMERNLGQRFQLFAIKAVCAALDIDVSEVIRPNREPINDETDDKKINHPQITNLEECLKFEGSLEPPIFVDHRRIDRLLEAADKGLEFKDYDSNKLRSTIISYLSDNGLMFALPPETKDDLGSGSIRYAKEVCFAQRYRCVRQTYGSDHLFDFWLSESSSSNGSARLLLLLSGGSLAEPAMNYCSYSTFSSFLPLIYECRELVNQSRVSQHIPDEPHPNPYAKFDDQGDHPNFLSQDVNLDANAYSEFARNWRNYLPSIGFESVGLPRYIDVLYYVRFADNASIDSKGSGQLDFNLYGYPIWIAPALTVPNGEQERRV